MGSIPDPPGKPSGQQSDGAEFVPHWMTLPDDQLLAILDVPERGIGSGWGPRPPLVKVSEEFACQEVPPCTDLLNDPAGVLWDEERWPNHLCEYFQVVSTGLWARGAVRPTMHPRWEDWQATWPLPIGKEAVSTALGVGPPIFEMELFGQIPFEGFEEALWALRVTGGDSAVDLFGLARSSGGSGDQRAYRPGKLIYVLRGSGTHLFRTIERAQRWWDRLRGETTGGRPAGSQVWGSQIRFWIGLRKAVRAVRANGDRLTQENVAARLGYSDRELRRWLKQYGIDWKNVPKIP